MKVDQIALLIDDETIDARRWHGSNRVSVDVGSRVTLDMSIEQADQLAAALRMAAHPVTEVSA